MSEPVVNVTVQLPPPQQVIVEQDSPSTVVVSAPSQVNTVSSSTQVVDVQQLGIVGIQGPPGPAGTAFALTYVLTNVSSWNQVHDFGYYPAVRLIDATGAEVEIDTEYPDSTHVYISFPTPFTGTVILS